MMAKPCEDTVHPCEEAAQSLPGAAAAAAVVGAAATEATDAHVVAAAATEATEGHSNQVAEEVWELLD